MKKAYLSKTISILMAIILTVLSVPVFSFAQTYGEWEYTILDDNTAAITGYTGNRESISIPNELDGYPVTVISGNMFEDYTELVKVLIPSSVTAIGEKAFYGCSLLEKIKYTGSLFMWCNVDISVDAIPENVVIYCNEGPSLKTKNSQKGIDISWASEESAQGYYVYRKTVSGSFKCIADVTDLAYTDAAVKSGIEYIYAVKGYSRASAGMPEARSSYMTSQILRLANPVIKLKNTADAINISWSKINGADKYQLYKKTGSDAYQKIATLAANTYEDRNVKAGTKYTYAVYALNGSSYKSAFTPLSAIRLTVPEIKAVNASDGMKVSWKKVAGAKGYYIYKKEIGGSYSQIANVSSLSYLDKAVKAGTKYGYAVYAYNGSSKSTCSPIAALRLKNPNVKLSNIDRGVKISWGKITGAKGYYVYRKTSSGSYSKIATTSSLSYTDKAAKKNTKYYYAVRAYNGTYKSAYTNNGITFKIYENIRPAKKGSFYYGINYRSPVAKTCDVFKHGRNLMLVNKEWELPENFKWDLVYWSNGKAVDAMSLNSKKYDSVDAVDRAAYAPLKQMFADAKKAGVPLVMISAYRSISLQDRLFTRSVNSYLRQGYSKAIAIKKANYSRTFTGTSEHNIGLGFDITAGGGLYKSFDQTAQFKWLQKNAANYGFILRYPKDKTSVTGIMYEPWHYRYVGVEAAKQMKKKGMCLEEYISYLDKKQG